MSLTLRFVDESLGQIVFGGVDASKYTGPLDLFPIVDAPVPGTDLKRLTVQVTSMTWYQDDNFTEFLPENTVFRTLLDTGSTFSHFPQPVLDHLYLTAGVEFLEAGSKIPYVDCSLGSTKATVLFRFGGLQGITINVPISEMVLPFAGDFFSNKRSACQLGVGLSSPLGFVLGDTFLRSVYMVVDLENKYIGLAQAATDVDITKDSGGVTEITQGPSGIPGVGRIAPVLPWPSEYIKEWEAYRRPSNHTDGATTTRSSFAMLPTPVSPDVSSVSSSPGRNPFPPITAARSATSSYVFLDG